MNWSEVALHSLGTVQDQLVPAARGSARAAFANQQQLDELHRGVQRTLPLSGKRAAEGMAERPGQRLAGYAVV